MIRWDSNPLGEIDFKCVEEIAELLDADGADSNCHATCSSRRVLATVDVTP